MSNLQVVRAWKDPDFRVTLSGVMIDHPAGQIELADLDLNPNRAGNIGFGSEKVKHKSPISPLMSKHSKFFTFCGGHCK